jgi:hypothetical protein
LNPIILDKAKAALLGAAVSNMVGNQFENSYKIEESIVNLALLIGSDAHFDPRKTKVSLDFEQAIIMIRALKECKDNLNLGHIKEIFA